MVNTVQLARLFKAKMRENYNNDNLNIQKRRIAYFSGQFILLIIAAFG